MEKLITLVAKCLVGYGGERYGVGMQFKATPEEAERLTKSGEAEIAPVKGAKPAPKTEASAATPAPTK